MREIYAPKWRNLIQLYNPDESKVLKEKDSILEWFSDHFNRLLNVPGDLYTVAKDKIMQRPVVPLLNDYPDMNELTDRFINIIKSLHTDMQTNVAMSSSVSDDFAVSNRVKQEYVLAPC